MQRTHENSFLGSGPCTGRYGLQRSRDLLSACRSHVPAVARAEKIVWTVAHRSVPGLPASHASGPTSPVQRTHLGVDRGMWFPACAALPHSRRCPAPGSPVAVSPALTLPSRPPRRLTSSPYTRSPRVSREKWSCRRDLNPRPPPYQGGALPTELQQPARDHKRRTSGDRSRRIPDGSRWSRARRVRRSRPIRPYRTSCNP